ncbi:metallophosphoesterase [Thermodesulfovibrio yellowstonii]|uniref:Ser/thr protein phosphatase family protein n=1 Tax=Thermodesulfovibrio yellowstonii (strain ATCC 51303 / DSM 11347 / YP87) TaxID=289376 RepID=B5YKW5_THEYD|nr:metallophosphoesterase [Thermodesulfovibrio yellowstonii]ACI20833.1 ser/thr protein phosphatase family protein [Thermodesulfovibrio yellowstonii DSM 11347]
MFFIIFFTIYGIINFYFFVKLKSILNFGWQFQLIISVFLLLMIFSPLIIRVSEKNGYETFAIGLSWIGYLWMAFVVLFLFFGILTDFGRLSMLVISKISGKNLFIILQKIPKTVYFLFPLGLSVIFLIYGYLEAMNIRVERFYIKSDKITKNVRIVQISDVHIGLIVREGRIKKIVEKIKEVNPDILVSTGDLVDAQIDRMNHIAELLKEIKTPYGKFAITGNHEFYAGLNKALFFTEKAGFKVLRNAGAKIKELNINIAGLDDTESERYGLKVNQDKVSLLNYFKNKGFTILLKHRPLIDKELIEYFDLQLSGHTHKGQFFPFSIATKLHYNNNDSGLTKINKDVYLYISRGTGTWGPPVRIFAPPEITVIDLLKK